jgi:hypothetical protein
MKHLTMFMMMLSLAVGAIAANQTKYTKEMINKHVSSWPEDSKKATDFMINKYGIPSGVTDNMLVWNEVKPFKRSIVYKEAVPHKFPMEHNDVLEHFIDYKSPKSDKVAAVWDFDGSVILERTKGEMSARCDKEAANILALNLADEVINGKRSAEDARTEYARQVMAMKDGKPEKLTEKLVFSPAQGNVGDPGEVMMDQLKKKETKQAQEEMPE